ncbi:MAG TPA: phage holin family protein [Actinomycetota bacterium]|jgi:uncharacterized membrane protein YqjE
MFRPEDKGGDPGDLSDRSIRDLLRLMADEASTLARLEIDLAKAELQEKKERAMPAARTLGVAAAVGVVALAALTTAAVLGLATVIPGWLAGLVIGIPVAVVALTLAASARSMLRAAGPPVPEATLETLKEDVEWAKHLRPSAAA